LYYCRGSEAQSNSNRQPMGRGVKGTALRKEGREQEKKKTKRK